MLGTQTAFESQLKRLERYFSLNLLSDRVFQEEVSRGYNRGSRGSRGTAFNLDLLDVVIPKPRARGNRVDREQRRWTGFIDLIAKTGERDAAKTKPRPRLPDPIKGNLHVASRVFGFGKCEQQILHFLAATTLSPALREAVKFICERPSLWRNYMLAALIAVDKEDLEAALDPSSRLVSYSFIEIETSDYISHGVRLTKKLENLLCAEILDERRFVDAIATLAPEPELTLSDYEHLRPEVEIMVGLIRSSLRSRRRGQNFLLYGLHGTGKTQLACLIGKMCEADLYMIGVDEQQGQSPSSRERLQSKIWVDRLLDPQSSVITAVDEAEDIFENVGESSSNPREKFSKEFLRRQIENNAVPCIWILNQICCVDLAFTRRMRFSIEFKPLNQRSRERVWRRCIGATSGLADEDVKSLAMNFSAAPALITNALDAARELAVDGKPSRGLVERVLEPSVKLQGGTVGRRRVLSDLADYRPELTNADADLETLATSLSQCDPARDSGARLCFFGPPGTGKTLSVRYLADRMGRECSVRRVSDIVSPFVGVTERNIRAAFEDAERSGDVLCIDEADSFLSNRSQAQRSWEVTETNEFLQQIESFNGIVACTTNMIDRLDPAVFRRFDFKVRFDWLRPDQACDLFRQVFAPVRHKPNKTLSKTLRQDLASIQNLAPGDFAAVARRQRLLKGPIADADLLSLLRQEVEFKDGPKTAIGFRGRG